MSEESLAERVERVAAWDDYCGNKGCPRGCGKLVELIEAIRALEAEAVELRKRVADQPAPTETVLLTPCKACGWALHKPSDGKCQRCGTVECA